MIPHFSGRMSRYFWQLWQAALWLVTLCWLGACSSGAAAPPCAEDPRCLRYGISAAIPILDPHNASAPEAGIIFRQIYETLVQRADTEPAFLPGLASSWEISAEGRVYTFQLRPDAVFHDGSRVDAAAVAANIDRIYASGPALSRASELLGPLSQYEVIEEFAIRFTLASPYAAFLDGLAQPFLGIASPAALQETNDLRYQFHQVGSGPFILEKYLPGELVELRRNANWHSAALAQPGIERLHFIFLQPEAFTSALEAGSVDIVDDLPPTLAQTLVGNSRYQLLPAAIPGLSLQLLLHTGQPPLNDKSLRQALLHATNRPAIINQVSLNFAPLAWAPLTASSGYANLSHMDGLSYDLSRAQELLAQAGYADSDGDTWLDRDGNALRLHMVVPAWSQLPAIANLLQEQWRILGIDLQQLPVTSRRQLADRVESGAWDLLPLELAGADPILLQDVFLQGSPYSAALQADDSLQDLLRSATQTQEGQLRQQQVYAIQAQLLQEALTMPLRDPTRLSAVRADIRDLRFDAYGFYPLMHAVNVDV